MLNRAREKESSFSAVYCKASNPQQHNTMIIGIPSLSTAAALFLAVLVDASPIGEYDISQDSNIAPWGKIKNMVVFGDRWGIYFSELQLSFY